MSLRKLILTTAGALWVAAATGCASEGPKPNDELTKAHTVVEQADKGDAQRYAAADLQRAHDELADADRAAGNKKYNDARFYAQRAEVDADVAVARGNAGEAQRAAKEVTDANATLEHETDRNANNSSGAFHN